MPLYEYRCRDCGHCVELLQTVKEMHEVRSRLRCQKCEGKMAWQFPRRIALVTDTTFLANRDDGFGNDEVARKRAYAKARRNGTDIGGKFWSPQLNSWVGSKAEVIAKARAKGRGVSGSVNAPAPELPPPEKKRYEVAEDMVQAAVQEVVEEHGGDVTPKERTQLVETTRGRLRGRQFDA